MNSVIGKFKGLATFIVKHNGLRGWAEKTFINIMKDTFIGDSLKKNVELEVLNHYIIECNKHEYFIASKFLNDMRNEVSKR